MWESPIGSCYLFNTDGLMVEKTHDFIRPVDFWEAHKDHDNYWHVMADDKTIILKSYEESCWLVEYEDRDYTVCDCSI